MNVKRYVDLTSGPALDLRAISPDEVKNVRDRSDDLSAPADLFVGPLVAMLPRIAEKDGPHAERPSSAQLLTASIANVDARAGIDPKLLRDREVVPLMRLPRPEHARERHCIDCPAEPGRWPHLGSLHRAIGHDAEEVPIVTQSREDRLRISHAEKLVRELQPSGDGLIHTIKVRCSSEALTQGRVCPSEITDPTSHPLIESRSHDLGERLPIDTEDLCQLMRDGVSLLHGGGGNERSEEVEDHSSGNRAESTGIHLV